jgi:hypothetical protein
MIGFVVAGAKNPVYDKLYKETLEVKDDATTLTAAAVSTITTIFLQVLMCANKLDIEKQPIVKKKLLLHLFKYLLLNV